MSLRRQGAEGAGDRHPVAKNVPGMPALNLPEGQHGGLEGRQLPADQCLQCGDHLGGNHDGVHAALGIRAMAAAPADVQHHIVAGAVDAAGPGEKRPRRIAGVHMLTNDNIHRRIPHAALAHHQPGVAACFLGRLKEPLHRAPPGVTIFRKPHGGAKGHGGVRIVAAGVHHAGPLRSIGQAAVLLNGQRVHIGADSHAGAVAVAQGTHQAVAVVELTYRNSQPLQRVPDQLPGLRLIPAQLRVAVQLAENILYRRHHVPQRIAPTVQIHGHPSFHIVMP